MSLNQKSYDQIYLDLNVVYRKIENINLPSTSTEYQSCVSDGIRIGKFLWEGIQGLSLYSDNEKIDDLSTESLKFMTVPAVLGYLYYNKICDHRLDTIKDTKIYYDAFLELIRDYKFKEIDKNFGFGNESREEKINRFKDEKSTKERYLQLEKYINQDNVDDEIKREYYLTSIKQWIYRIQSDYKILNDEIYMMENEDSIKKEMPDQAAPKETFKPFVLTSDMVRQSVFGMGYKSLPTYSLEEYYVRQVEMGHLPDPNVDKIPAGDGSSVRRIVPDVQSEEEKLAEKNDGLEDTDDIEYRLKQIRMDNYKDENRRGCGNTLNKG